MEKERYGARIAESFIRLIPPAALLIHQRKKQSTYFLCTYRIATNSDWALDLIELL